MLWGWTDTVKDNYPCVPPDFSSKCLEWSHVEVLFSVLNKLIPAIGDLLFTQAWNLRLGTNNLPPADLYMLAEQRGINADMLPVIVEEDTWNYQTTRNGAPASGPSMVRRVYVLECAWEQRLRHVSVLFLTFDWFVFPCVAGVLCVRLPHVEGCWHVLID